MSRYSVGIIGLICLLAMAFCAPAPVWSANSSGKQEKLLLMYFMATPDIRVFNLYRIEGKGKLEEIDGLPIHRMTNRRKEIYWGEEGSLGKKFKATLERGVSKEAIEKFHKSLELKKPTESFGDDVWIAFYNHYAPKDKKGKKPQMIDFISRKVLAVNLNFLASDSNHKKLFSDVFNGREWNWQIKQNKIYEKLPFHTQEAINKFANPGGTAPQPKPPAKAAAGDTTAKLQQLEDENRKLKNNLKRANDTAKAAKDNSDKLEVARGELLLAIARLKGEVELLQKEKANLQKLSQAAQNDPQKALVQLSREMQALSRKVGDLGQSVKVLPQDVVRSVERSQRRGVAVVFPWGHLVLVLAALMACVIGLLYLLLRSPRRQGKDVPVYDPDYISGQFNYLREQIQQIQQSIPQATLAQNADNWQTGGLSEELRQLMSQIDQRLAQLNSIAVNQGQGNVTASAPRMDELSQTVDRLERQIEALKNQRVDRPTVSPAPQQETPSLTGQPSLGAGQSPAYKEGPQDLASLGAPQAAPGASSSDWSRQGGRQNAGYASKGQNASAASGQTAGVQTQPKAAGTVQVTTSPTRPAGDSRHDPPSQKPTEPAARDKAPKPTGGYVPSAITRDATQRDAVLALEKGIRKDLDQIARKIVRSKFHTRVLATYDRVAGGVELLRNFFRPESRQGEELRFLHDSLVGPLLEAWQTLRRDKLFTHPPAEEILSGTEESRSVLAKALTEDKLGSYQEKTEELLYEWGRKIRLELEEGGVAQNRQSDLMERALVDFVRDYVLPFLNKWSAEDVETRPQFKDMKSLGITAKGLAETVNEVRQRCGIEYFEPNLWDSLDPKKHQVVGNRVEGGSNNEVAEVKQSGAIMWLGVGQQKDKLEVLCKAKVVVTVRDS